VTAYWVWDWVDADILEEDGRENPTFRWRCSLPSGRSFRDWVCSCAGSGGGAVDATVAVASVAGAAGCRADVEEVFHAVAVAVDAGAVGGRGVRGRTESS